MCVLLHQHVHADRPVLGTKQHVGLDRAVAARAAAAGGAGKSKAPLSLQAGH